MTDKKDLIAELEKLTITELIALIKSGEATASHFAVARGILNDNKTFLLMSNSDESPVAHLADMLPFDAELEGPSEARQ